MLYSLRRINTLILCLGLAGASLLIAAWDAWQALGPQYSGRVISSIEEQIRTSPHTMARIYAFVFKVALMHLALGLVVWFSTLLTTYALDSLKRLRILVALAWFAALTLTIGLINADLYPWSRSGHWSRSINDFLAPSFPLWKLTVPTLCSVWIGLAVTAIKKQGWTRPALRAGVWGLVSIAFALTLDRLDHYRDADGFAIPPSGAPHVILIGFDSLRPAMVGDRNNFGYMPELSSFAGSGHRFTDATTPLARTFPSWMAMLTGRRPTTTGIRENLMPRELVDATGSLPVILSEKGYQTIYATDEVRFSNIETSYGFESALTPRIGASDFLLGRVNDLPLTNLFANTFIGQWLFPETFANRAAAATYDPKSFVTRLERGVHFDGRPVFLAMHLTLPHWPYRWRDEESVFSTYDSAYAYLASVVEADRQFGAIMAVLRKKGLLQNSLVMTFSDHGEGLNLPDDHLVRMDAGTWPKDLPSWIWGHGTSVLSAPQFEIFMAAKTFGLPGYATEPRIHENAISIEDIAPTILDVVDQSSSAHAFDGVSLADNLRTGESRPPGNIDRRIRFTESAYSTPSLRQGAADEASLIEEGSDVFRVNPKSGWVEVRVDLWPELMAVRERAAIGRTQLLAAVPTDLPGVTSYFLVPRSGGTPLRLFEPPRKELGTEAQDLWTALFREYGEELGQPSAEFAATKLASCDLKGPCGGDTVRRQP